VPVTTREATWRRMPNFSCRAAETTCRRLISEVKPASTRLPKNSTPNTGPPGIIEITCGKVMKLRATPLMPDSSPTPTPCWKAMKPRVANTPKPASSSKEEFAKAVTKPVGARFERRGR